MIAASTHTLSEYTLDINFIPRNRFRKAHTLYRHEIKYLVGVAGNSRNKIQQYSLN
jgi:hypothetical protein